MKPTTPNPKPEAGRSRSFDYKAFRAHQKTPQYWGGFDRDNGKHKYILSLMHQMGWTVFVTKGKWGNRAVPDVVRLGEWLQSEKSPVKKPLRKMDDVELSKIITAMENMI